MLSCYKIDFHAWFLTLCPVALSKYLKVKKKVCLTLSNMVLFQIHSHLISSGRWQFTGLPPNHLHFFHSLSTPFLSVFFSAKLDGILNMDCDDSEPGTQSTNTKLCPLVQQKIERRRKTILCLVYSVWTQQETPILQSFAILLQILSWEEQGLIFLTWLILYHRTACS